MLCGGKFSWGRKGVLLGLIWGGSGEVGGNGGGTSWLWRRRVLPPW